MHTLLTAAYNGPQKLEFAALGVAAPGVLVSKYCPPFPHLVTQRGVDGGRDVERTLAPAAARSYGFEIYGRVMYVFGRRLRARTRTSEAYSCT